MRFTTREDIELPIDDVFAAISDFQGFERAALRRGAEVARLEDGTQGWTIRFRHRGRQRELVSRIIRLDAPEGLTTEGRVGGLDGTMDLELTALAPYRTRLRVDLNIKPRTLTARLLVQSLRLAKTSLNNRFKSRVRVFARNIESRG